jgi:hypothetical protein
LERHCDRGFPAVVRDCVAGVGCEPARSKGSDCGMTPHLRTALKLCVFP